MEEKPVQNTKTDKKQTQKQTFAFVTFLIVVTLVLLGLAVYTQKPLPTPTPKPSGATFPTYAHTTLALTPPVNNPALGSYTTDVNINTNQDKVTAVQLELSFDPKVLTNASVKIGPFIQNPVVLLKKIDQANGRISLAFGISAGQKGVSGTGTVATISFNQQAGAKGSTTIDFLPKTAVVAQGIAQSVLKQSVGSFFYLNQASSAPTATISPVKTPVQ